MENTWFKSLLPAFISRHCQIQHYGVARNMYISLSFALLSLTLHQFFLRYVANCFIFPFNFSKCYLTRELATVFANYLKIHYFSSAKSFAKQSQRLLILAPPNILSSKVSFFFPQSSDFYKIFLRLSPTFSLLLPPGQTESPTPFCSTCRHVEWIFTFLIFLVFVFLFIYLKHFFHCSHLHKVMSASVLFGLIVVKLFFCLIPFRLGL